MQICCSIEAEHPLLVSFSNEKMLFQRYLEKNYGFIAPFSITYFAKVYYFNVIG